MCFGCSKEPSHSDGSSDHPQRMFWLRNKEINFLLGTLNHIQYELLISSKSGVVISILTLSLIVASFVNIFLSISFNMCFGCSKEQSHQDGSFEYPQHMFWLRNKKINFLLHTLS